MSVKFGNTSTAGKELVAWWYGLENDRGGRAELRRAKSITDVVMIPTFHGLLSRLRPVMQNQIDWEERIAMIAGLASHVKHIAPGLSIPGLMAGGNPPPVSPLRFRRLIQRDKSELYPAMIRVLRMLGGRADLYELAESIYFWGDRIRKNWAY